MKCKQCGEDLPEALASCPKCGATDETAFSDAIETEESPKEQKSPDVVEAPAEIEAPVEEAAVEISSEEEISAAESEIPGAVAEAPPEEQSGIVNIIPETAPAVKEKSDKKPLLWILVSILLLGVIGCAVYFSGILSPSPKAPILYSGNDNKVYATLSEKKSVEVMDNITQLENWVYLEDSLVLFNKELKTLTSVNSSLKVTKLAEDVTKYSQALKNRRAFAYITSAKDLYYSQNEKLSKLDSEIDYCMITPFGDCVLAFKGKKLYVYYDGKSVLLNDTEVGGEIQHLKASPKGGVAALTIGGKLKISVKGGELSEIDDSLALINATIDGSHILYLDGSSALCLYDVKKKQKNCHNRQDGDSGRVYGSAGGFRQYGRRRLYSGYLRILPEGRRFAFLSGRKSGN